MSTNSDPAPAAAKQQKQTIEKTYQKKSQLEHILLRPDTYIGSVEKVTEKMWVFDNDSNCMVQKEIEYVPGLYKIFDEILVNAADNKQRDKKMDCIKIDIDMEGNSVSVWNNGQGIPVVMHKDENMYVPTMIFGHLLTSSNYNDEEEKVTGGRNGYGAKLCNIFSTKFTVETAAREYKRQFKQTWASNMTKTSDPRIKEFSGEDFTKITFSPDLSKFKMEKLDDGIVSIMSRRAYDVAASTRGVKVFLNGKRLPVKTFKDYVDLFVKKSLDDSDSKAKVMYETPNERWEVAVTLSDHGFQQMSFVNSIATTKGGRHVDYVADMIVKQITEAIKKKNKGGVAIKPHQIKTHMWLFINCLIVNPTFDSQTKENMTLQMKSFGSKCTLSDKFMTSIIKSEIVDAILMWAKFKADTELAKTSGKKQNRVKGVAKLDDANEAGKKYALKCTLILTEGDSAKALAIAGLSVIGRDYYGVFPLRGKLLNVREATHKQVFENPEICNLVKILGLQYKKKYNTEDDMKTLRYGKVMIMTDQDQDGSHIKGLIINFIHHNWPELLRRNFLEEFITPIVRATKNKENLSFYSLPELEEWKAVTPNHNTYKLKYYKGLGTSTSVEAREYFRNMDRHRIRFRYEGQADDDHILLAFSKKHIDHRKEWLTNYMNDSKRRKELGLPDNYLYMKDTRFVSYKDFINLELVLFSNADNIRSIPSLVDGFKPGQRKVMFTCFKRNDKKEVKVVQLAGSIIEQAAYHHGETSLYSTILNLAQNFVGSNNINLLQPIGQFGTRLAGGKDSASPRYINTKMSPLARIIFNPMDDVLLKYETDDNIRVEPVWYIPIIPMSLVNGADGIGTGWMTKIPNFNPREIVRNVKRMLAGEEPERMLPWYKNFLGTIDDCEDTRFVVSGEVSILGDDKLEVTELPLGVWTQAYKDGVLETFLCGSEQTGKKVKAIFSDYKDYCTDTTIRFVITMQPGEMTNIQKEGIHKVLKLQTTLSTSSMCLFDEMGCLRRFDTAVDILKEFYKLRLTMYQKRKDYMEGMLEAEANRLKNQARFIMEKCSGQVSVENKKRKQIVDELIRKGYAPDSVREWKERCKTDIEPDEQVEDVAEEDETGDGSSSKAGKPSGDPEKDFKQLTEVKKYDYLLGMNMWMLTDERKSELLKQKEAKMAELEQLRRKTKEDLWRADLEDFLDKLDKIEEKERIEESQEIKKSAKEQKGRGKKAALNDTLPSHAGERVEPIISEDLRKRIQTAMKVKKKIKKDNSAELANEEPDEFDMMIKSKKTIKDKIGTPEEIEKKAMAARKKPKDGLKQTKLNFKKLNGDGGEKNKKGSLSSDDDMSIMGSGSDVEFSSVANPLQKERVLSKRAATKVTKYHDSGESSVAVSESEEDLFENEAVKEHCRTQQKIDLSDDDELSMEKEKYNASAEDMFDSLVGRSQSDKPNAASAAVQERKKPFSDDSDTDFDVGKISDDDDDFEPLKKPAAKVTQAAPVPKAKPAKPAAANKRAPAKKAATNNDDEGSPKKKKAPPKKRQKLQDSDSDMEWKSDTDVADRVEEPIAHVANRPGRRVQQKKYTFSDDSDSM